MHQPGVPPAYQAAFRLAFLTSGSDTPPPRLTNRDAAVTAIATCAGLGARACMPERGTGGQLASACLLSYLPSQPAPHTEPPTHSTSPPPQTGSHQMHLRLLLQHRLNQLEPQGLHQGGP